MIRALGAAALALLSSFTASAEGDLTRIRRAVTHIVSTQLESGLFRYDFDFLAARPTGDDNIVRQAGALYALSAYLVETGDRTVVAPLEKGLDALVQRSLPIGKRRAQSWLERAGVFGVASWRLERALASRGWLYARTGDGSVVSGDGSYAGATSGATALALIAEVSLHRATGSDRFAAQRAAWLAGLLSLRVPDGGMRNHPETLETSPFADGETWLALALYHDAFPDDAAAAHALADFEAYALDHYRREPEKDFYHWGALASAARLSRGDVARLAAFAADQAEFVLRIAPAEKVADYSTCALVEGLASAIAVIRSQPGRAALLAQLADRVSHELARNRALQIAPGQRRMALPAGGELRAPSLAGYAGAFLAGPHTAYTRVDLTQHCISSFLLGDRYRLSGNH